MANDDAITSLGFDARQAKQGADEFAQAAQKVIDANRQVEASEQKAADTVETTSTKRTRARKAAASDSSAAAAAERAAADAIANVWSVSVDKQVESLQKRDRFLASAARSYDPLGTAVQKIQGDISRLTGILDTEGLAEEKAIQATNALAGAKRKLADAQQAVVATSGVDRLTEKFDPAITSARQMTAELAELNAAFRAGVNIAGGYTATFDRIIEKYDEGALAAKRAADAQKALIDQARTDQNALNAQQHFNTVLNVNPGSGAGSAAASAQVFMDAAEAEKAAATEQEHLAAAAQKYRDQINPILPLQRAYQASLGEINKLAAAGKLTESERVAAMAASKASLDRNVEALTKHAKATAESTAGSRQMQFVMTNLSFQVNDVATSLASGISPARTFAQQAGQFVQVFQQGGGVKSVLTEAAAAIRGFITPTTAAIAGFAALGIGIGFMVAKAVELDSRARALGVTLRGMGTDGLASVGDFQKGEHQLREYGIAADEARAALDKLARTPGINPARATDIARTGADLGAIRGTGVDAGTTELLTALKDGPEALIKLGIELRKIGPDEAKHIRDLKDQAGSVVAADNAYDLLSKRLGGAYKSSLSDSAKAWIDLKNAFNDFLTEMAKSGVIQGLLGELRGVLDGIKSTIDEINRIKGLVGAAIGAVGTAINSVTSAGDAATQQAIKNQQEMASALSERDSGVSSIASGSTLSRLIPSMIHTESRGDPNAVSPAGAMGLMQIMPGTARGLGLSNPFDPTANIEAGTRYITQLVQQFGNVEDALKAYNWGPGNMRSALAGQKFIPSSVQGYASGILSRAGLSGRETANDLSPKAGASGVSDSSVNGISVFAPPDQTNQLEKQTREYIKANDATRQFGDAQVYAEARIRGLAEAEARGITGTAALASADLAAKQAVEQHRIERDKASTIVDKETAAMLRGADAFKISQAAGYRVQAENQAQLEKLQGRTSDAGQRTEQILRDQAASAVLSSRQQIAAALPQLALQEKLAEATKLGAAAAHEQELQNEAAARTQDVLAKAEATRNPALIAQAKALNEAALAEIRRTDAAKQAQQIYAAINERNNQIALVRQDQSLLGQTPEIIQAANDRLREQQRLLALGDSVSEDIKKQSLANVDALSAANVQYQEAVRNQQRLEEGIRGIASTIENTLTKSIDDAFSGAKVESWGARIKAMLGSLSSQLSDSLFIKPLIGTLLGGVGLNNLASQFGSFGGAGLGGLLGSSSGGSGSITVTPNADGTFSLSNLSSAASLGKTLFGGSEGANSAGGFLDSIGLGGVGNFFSGGAGGIFAHTPTAADFAAGVGPVINAPGTLFGNLTLGSAATSIGAGFGAGSLLNGLLGGNTLTGSIGSGIGSIAGTLLPSAFGLALGPLGGILGGALGGLAGLFGNNKPSNFSSGDFVDLSTGKTSGFASSGNAQNDQSVRQISSDIASFTQAIKSASGGTLAGMINPDVGTRDGTQISYSIYGQDKTGKIKSADTQDAVNQVKLILAQSLEGISDTMKTVINQITDPNDLQTAIQFASVYDHIATAAKDAFSSIPSDLEQTGPFAQAKDQIKSVFDEITANAQKFGLSLEPVNAALDEANKRLTQDFDRSISDAITAIENPLQAQIDAEKRAGDARIKEAQAVNGNLDQVAKLNALNLQKITSDVTGSVADFNQSIRDAMLALQDSARAQVETEKRAGAQRLAQAEKLGGDIVAVNQLNAANLDKIWRDQTQSIRSLADDLRGGALSGLGTVAQLAAANDNFQRSLKLVQGGNLAEIANLATKASSAIDLSTKAYGNAPQTAGLRASILTALDGVLASRSFAGGTDSTPPGWIRVGERGPEWMLQGGGATVLSNGQSPGGGEMVSLLRELLTELRANTGTARVGHYETVKQLQATREEGQRRPLYESTRRSVKLG